MLEVHTRGTGVCGRSHMVAGPRWRKSISYARENEHPADVYDEDAQN